MDNLVDKFQKCGLDRNVDDKFYTRKSVARWCCRQVSQYVDIDYEQDLIIEPSAGDGKFIKYINKLCKNTLYYDIEPDCDKIIKQDYLKLDVKHNIFGKNNGKENSIHIVGNPPFGRQSSMAIKFIKKSGLFSKSISFILPKSFKKDSMQSKFPKDFHLIYSEDLPENSFRVNNEIYDVPCVFQIWIRQAEDRKTIQKLEPDGFKFVKKNDNPSYACRRVGVNAGKVYDTIDECSQQSHYFIKLDRKPEDKILKKLNNIKFEDNNTVGAKSISKQEFITKYNSIFNSSITSGLNHENNFKMITS